MNAIEIRSKTRPLLFAIAALILTLTWAQGVRAGSDEDVQVTLNVGETYLIKGVAEDTAPDVNFTAGTKPFSVQTQEPDGLVILAAQAGEGTVRAQLASGATTYHVVVHSVSDPNSPLTPGVTPPPLTEDKSASPGSVTADASGGSGKAGAVVSASLVVPRQGQPALSSENKFSSNPPALDTTDNLEREPAVNGHHVLPDDAISMMGGTSRVYDFNLPIRRVSVADTKVADIQVISPHQILLIGHQPGFTTLVVWDKQGRYQERQVRIEKEGHQQVLLDVTVAELNRSRMEEQGIDYSVALANYGLSLSGLPGNVASPYTPGTQLQTSGTGGSSAGGVAPPGGNIFPLLLSNSITYALAAQNSNVLSNAFFRFVEDHSLGRILAEPRLLANSGEEAKFLSGGEIPIVIAQALNTSVVFKQFGTSVSFLPTVIGKHDVELVVKPEVSKPDFSSGVQLFGFTVPAFVTRRAETAVRMRESQTLIIAGLILDDTRSEVRKVPYLGDIPVAGALFRSTSNNHQKTELMMTVTPHIVRPIPEDGTLALPSDRPPLTNDEIRTGPVNPPDASRPRLY